MAELFVPKIIDQLSDVAFTKVREGVNLLTGVEKEVHNLSFKLTRIQKLLHDAERRRLNEVAVGIWLEELEDITYEMEDVLDEWNIKIHKPKNLDQKPELTRTRMSILLKKVRSFIPSICSCLKEVPVSGDIALKIKEINSKLDSTMIEANKFNFVIAHSALVDSNEFKRPLTTSTFDESKVHNRGTDKEVLLKHLLFESRNNTSKEVEKDRVKVISIVGVGGSGKTTLAQILYNDDKVQKHFELRKWVCVSDPFDVRRIAIALLESPEKNNINVLELEALFHRVKNTFSGKRFVLVLDDVWTEKYSDWEPLIGLLKDGAPGSIILVTTRKEVVAKVVGTDYLHPLSLMSDSDCWLILKRIALSERSELCEKVEKIGRKIAEKCKGLPVVAKTLGSLLQLKDTVQEWQEVLNSKIWQMEEASVDLFPHFYLSYNELSPQLKRCFSYCAVFPKDTQMNAEELVRLWMAQGYLGPPILTGDDRRRTAKGREYLKILAMCSFFEGLKRADWDESVIESCKMHDIVHDFAQFLTKNECRAFDEVDCQNIETNGGHLSKERVRHLTLLGKTKSINSSVVLDIEKVQSFYVTSHVEPPQDLCSCLRSVRSLKFSKCQLGELPQEIGNLIHLRFLDVSWNPLRELPETICDLYYLESLDVSWCYKLLCLPQRIGDLVHLRYLLNNRTDAVKQMPPGLHKLTSLWSLTRFIADGAPSNDMVKLKYLNQLEELRIDVCGQVNFKNAQLEEKTNLQDLELLFRVEDLDIETTNSIEMMKPPPNLQMLGLIRYPRPELPKWIAAANSLINNLRGLVILMANISSLPALGKLSSLQSITLYELPNLKRIGRELFGLHDHLQAQGPGHYDGDNAKVTAFPRLKRLSIEFLGNWETWEDISEEDEEKMKNGTVSIMPRLEQLEIKLCRELKALPHWLLGKPSSLKSLTIVDCDQLRERYSEETGPDWMKIAHVPEVIIKWSHILDQLDGWTDETSPRELVAMASKTAADSKGWMDPCINFILYGE